MSAPEVPARRPGRRRFLLILAWIAAPLSLLASASDATPVASVVEARPFAAAAALVALGAFLAARPWARWSAGTGLVVAAGALLWSLRLLFFAYGTTDVTFQGAVELAGTILTPRSAGPHPGVVFVHGSGRETRREAMAMAKHLARHGIAALTYDKHGSGGSGGEPWQPYAVYAEDAAAAVRCLRSRPGVDAARVGLLGHSEGGWVAPLVAARVPLAFVGVTGATDLTPAEQVIYETGETVRRAGFGPEAVAEAVGLQRRVMEYQRTGEGGPVLKRRLAAASREEWFEAAELPSRLWPLAEYAWWRSVMDFDPLPHWQKVACPVLAVSGGEDTRSDARRSQRRIAAALLAGGNGRFTGVVFPRADHVLLEWPLGHRVPPPRWARGYPRRLVRWIREAAAS